MFIAVLNLSAQERIAGSYKGKVTSVVMNGDPVSKDRHKQDFVFGLEKSNVGYVLTGKLDFYGGPAHHVIDFDSKQTIINIESGKITKGLGKGHISVKVFKFISALNKDFNVTSVTGIVTDDKLRFTINVIIPDYKNGYKASFTFEGVKQ